MARLTFSLGRIIARTHALLALTLLLVVVTTMATQVSQRSTFASTELYDDVMDRWGTPIVQAAPSVRFAEHGSVFHELEALPLTRQTVAVDADMSYRKRGLVYFSGFEFRFAGHYRFTNPRSTPIDVAFVFPLDVQRDRVLLSNLEFSVDGEPAPLSLQEPRDKLLWTGRVDPDQEVVVDIAYRGRGLDAFRYDLDPSLPVRGLDLTLSVDGGSNFDYPPGVVPASHTQVEGDTAVLRWRYDALEAGVPLGAVLPSEKGYDAIIATIIRRAWVPFGIFFVGIVAMSLRHDRRLRAYEAALLCAGWLFFFVMLPYLAAFVHFYVAWVTALAFCGGLLTLYQQRLAGPRSARVMLALLVATLFVPTLAVVLQGYTGLVYTLAIFAGLAWLMVTTTRPGFSAFVETARTLWTPLDRGVAK